MGFGIPAILQHGAAYPGSQNGLGLQLPDGCFAVGGMCATTFRREYRDGRAELFDLYEKSKRKRWNASDLMDWSQELNPENPEQMPTRPCRSSAHPSTSA